MPEPDPPAMSSGPLPWRDRIDLLTRSPQITPARLVGGAVLAVALALGAWFLLRTPSTPPPESFLPVAGTSGDHTSATTSTTDAAFVIADAAGAVAHPGVYKLSGAARVTDLIDAAGGPAEDADLDRLNLAAVVSDGERVYVPRRGEVVVADVSSATGDGRSTGPVNLNTATLAQLDALPGIGPSTAQAIIDERTRRGGFRAVDDLLDVRGIGPAKLDAIRDLVTV